MHGTVERHTSEHSYLGLLARVKKALKSAKEVSVPAEQIRRFQGQPREYFDEKHINGLRDSIDAGGQTTPGIIRKKPGKTPYELIDGECRWLGVLGIPASRRPLYRAQLIEADDDVCQYLISGIANFNRRGHTALEICNTIDQMLQFELPMKEIASLLGISEMWAYQMHGLKNLDARVKKLLDPKRPRKEQLPVSAAVELSKMDKSLQYGLAQRVMQKDVTLTRLRGEVVRVANRAGKPVRTRLVEPRKKYESLGNKIDAAERLADDLENIVKNAGIDQQLQANARDVGKFLRQLQRTQQVLSRVEQHLRKKAGR